MASCTDGITNGTETGIDCGGTCEPGGNMTTEGRRAELYVTNNSEGSITKYDLTAGEKISLETNSTAAECMYYDSANDILVQASRLSLQLDAYAGTSLLMAVTVLKADLSSAADLESRAKLYAIEDADSLAQADQRRIAGTATLRGNPIDAAYDNKTKTVFIAGIGNGKILGNPMP
jgi:hypothetical protein